MTTSSKVITPKTTQLLGLPIALVDYTGVVDWISAMTKEKDRGYVCVAATHTLMACREDPELRAAVANTSFTVPDGQPIVWALRLNGHRLPDRVYGPELMTRTCARGAATGMKFYLYGSRDNDALTKLQCNLEHSHPGLQVVGSYSPPFRSLSVDEYEAIAENINRSGADVVWVGIGVPKQEKWMARMRPLLDAPVLIGVGAAFDFHAGLIPQAPAWMQKRGLEWAFRLMKEPRRLWRRYARYNLRFVAAVAREYLRRRRSPA